MITFFEDSQHHNNNNDNQKGHLGKSKLCMIICMFFLEDFLQVFFHFIVLEIYSLLFGEDVFWAIFLSPSVRMKSIHEPQTNQKNVHF